MSRTLRDFAVIGSVSINEPAMEMADEVFSAIQDSLTLHGIGSRHTVCHAAQSGQLEATHFHFTIRIRDGNPTRVFFSIETPTHLTNYAKL